VISPDVKTDGPAVLPGSQLHIKQHGPWIGLATAPVLALNTSTVPAPVPTMTLHSSHRGSIVSQFGVKVKHNIRIPDALNHDVHHDQETHMF
jgi:hypothetical protein